MKYIEVTDLAQWHGPHTGIQKVTYSFAERFFKEGDVEFIAYDSRRKKFVTVDFEILRQSSEVKSEAVPPPKLRQKVKRNLMTGFRRLPVFMQSLLEYPLRLLNRAFRKVAATLIDRSHIVDPFKGFRAVEFINGSPLVLLDAGWQREGMIEQVAELKDLYQLRILLHVNDILPIFHPHLFADELPPRFTRYINQGLVVAEQITVISEASRQDVLRYSQKLKMNPPEVTTIRLGEDLSVNTPKKPEGIFPKDFLFCVGTVEIRKNYNLIYQAAKLAQSEGRPFPHVIIAGRNGWLSSDFRHVVRHDPQTKSKIRIINGASDAELSWLYDRCMFTLFPALCEGWGLPIAESLGRGKFCITSRASSMLEIAPELIDYHNPFDARELFDQVERYISDKRYQKLNKKIERTYKPYTWDESFSTFRKVVARVEGQRG